jgi:hypothetical protein
MTIINGIEIDDISIRQNEIRTAIENNTPIEDKLRVIAVVSNPCLYAKRYILFKEFVHRMESEETNVELYVVELVYKDQKFIITDKKNKKHLQIRTETPLWHKENMINLGVKHLLPKDYKAFAWIDADIEFENTTWVADTLKLLNGAYDIVQIFSHCVDMDKNETTMKVFTSGAYQYIKHKQYFNKEHDYSHPGFAWAMTRNAYEKVGGLYEKAILGSGDNIMMFCLLNSGASAINENSSEDYKNSILEFQKRAKKLRFGYVPGVIRHYFHGSKKNRKYNDRWKILLKYDYSPGSHITKNKQGILIPTKNCPLELLDEILEYFAERNEDE